MENKIIADKNFRLLTENPYPGRGIVIGRDEYGKPLQIYWIMGRSDNSRNRVFSIDGERVFTEPANPATAGDTSLTLYNAMGYKNGCHVVSNGKQTDDILEAVNASDSLGGLVEGLFSHTYEPDKPNYTPRISGVCSMMGHGRLPAFQLSILRKSSFEHDDTCDRFYYDFGNGNVGFGRMITTYSGDGNPLPSFSGEPLLVPLRGEAMDVLETYWAALNEANRVSLVVKSLNFDGTASRIFVKNKYEKV